MKFRIIRSSLKLNTDKPCDFVKYDGTFYGKCGELYPIWYMELNTIEDLMEFKDKIGFDIKISKTRGINFNIDTIEIIDDYI